MITQQQIRLTKLALALSVALAAAPVFAQNTTSAIGGRISAADGKPAAGAQVQIVHAESGSVSNVVTDAEGRYVARGLRVGGPYTIVITKDGVTERRENVFIELAETAAVDATLGQQMQTVTVTGSAARSEIFSNNAMGSVTSISRADLETQASINRNLQDFARIDPRISQTDKDRGEMSVAGQNSRYNSMTIDGVAINDTFGLEANGSPTARQPISMEAIASVQVNVANYDVTQRGYTGANINAVTKSGTNQYHGGAYYVTRDDRLVGKRYNRSTDAYVDAPDFKDNTKGLWVSGPLVQDKLFFFALAENYESSRSAPEFGAIGSGAGTTVGISPNQIARLTDIAKNRYNFDLGSTGVPAGTKMKVEERMVKFDWNISDDHRASLRYSKTSQNEPIFPGFSQSGVALSSQFYNQDKTIETLVGQVFSDWTQNFSTEFKVSQRDYDSVPVNNATLPTMSFSFTGALPSDAPSGTRTGTRFLNSGTESSRHNNVLGTKTLDIYAGANYLWGDHEFKVGADYTSNEVYNAFLQNVYGNYTFQCDNNFTYANVPGASAAGAVNCATATSAQIDAAIYENFSRGRPSSYTVQLPVAGGSLSNAIAQFTMKNTGFFLQDNWSVNKNLTVSAGVRVDLTNVDNNPLRNAAVAQPTVAGNAATFLRQTGGYSLDNTRTFDGNKLWQPRVGFNYKFDSARPMQLRGGAGLFQGAAATVWMSNPFSNPGAATRSITCSGSGATRCPNTDGLFTPDVNAQRTVTGSTPAANVDILSPDLKQPSIWKANLAFEHELPWNGLVFGAELLATQNKDAIFYQHLNLGAPTRTGTDGRALYYNANGLNASCYTFTNNAAGTATGCQNTAKALSNLSYDRVLVAQRTDKGDAQVVTLSVTSPTRKGFGWSVAYSHTNATEVSPLTSSTSNSSWSGRSVFNPNEEVAANSSYLVKDRINARLSWENRFFGNYRTRLGVFYEGREGKPYSWTINNDLNGDGLAGNDLMYIPSGVGSGEVVFFGDTATNKANETKFWDIVESNKALRNAKGGVVERNSAFSPWTNSFDVKITQEIPGFMAKHKASFSLDILNFGNLLNKKWGRIEEVGFQSAGAQARSFVDYVGLNAAGKYVYAVRNNVEDLDVRQAKGESQWAIQATVKYEF
ncbi:TonB-dependent receptor [Telluria aromaticivorans]|uniref:TonB-dependent receptor n=1 Tax=Telluria aromaticivorans TaxID=2725995 RepID=A0A7Y2K2H5_9BURK|nr:TonB-dependent receptor [Telluria aromaticivorans]NNG25356.1 TonB-dependent receptor [Telluria aromaticivorans]